MTLYEHNSRRSVVIVNPLTPTIVGRRSYNGLHMSTPQTASLFRRTCISVVRLLPDTQYYYSGHTTLDLIVTVLAGPEFALSSTQQDLHTSILYLSARIMAGSNSSQPPVQVNGTTSGFDPDTQGQIALALMQNGGIERIKATFRQRLDEAGWSQDLKEYTTRLFRSGAAVTYDDALTIIMRNINTDGPTANGSADGGPVPNLSIPREAAQGGAEAVKKELAKIVKATK